MNERLADVQRRLDDMGVKRIHIDFAESAKQLLRPQLENAVVTAFEQFLNGDYTELEPFGDSLGKSTNVPRS